MDGSVIANFVRLLLLVTVVGMHAGATLAQEDIHLSLLWSRTFQSNQSSGGAPEGLILSSSSEGADASNAFLAKMNGQLILLPEPNAEGPGREVPLEISGEGLHIAKSRDGTFWVGGLKNERIEIGGRLSEGYLARIDASGRTVWQRTFGGRSQRSIQSLGALPGDEIIVAGRDNDRTWVARISAQGTLIWERFIGAANAASVVSSSDRILVATQEAETGSASAERLQKIVLYVLDMSGEIKDKKTIREAALSKKNIYFSRLKVERRDDAFFIFSSWSGYQSEPTEVVKLDTQYQIIWRKLIPETVEKVRQLSLLCTSYEGVLANGSPVVACSSSRKITIFNLDPTTGVPTTTNSQIPNCTNGGASVVVRIALSKADTALVFGSKSTNQQTAGCSWLAEVPLNGFKHSERK